MKAFLQLGPASQRSCGMYFLFGSGHVWERQENRTGFHCTSLTQSLGCGKLGLGSFVLLRRCLLQYAGLGAVMCILSLSGYVACYFKRKTAVAKNILHPTYLHGLWLSEMHAER